MSRVAAIFVKLFMIFFWSGKYNFISSLPAFLLTWELASSPNIMVIRHIAFIISLSIFAYFWNFTLFTVTARNISFLILCSKTLRHEGICSFNFVIVPESDSLVHIYRCFRGWFAHLAQNTRCVWYRFLQKKASTFRLRTAVSTFTI